MTISIPEAERRQRAKDGYILQRASTSTSCERLHKISDIGDTLEQAVEKIAYGAFGDNFVQTIDWNFDFDTQYMGINCLIWKKVENV
jgi:hypothetical protein